MEKKRDLIAAVDAGTTGTRCCIINADGATVAGGYVPMQTLYPAPGLVEQDPSTITAFTFKAVAEAVSAVDPREIAGLCITVQRNSFVPMAGDGRFLTNLITWQDQRGDKTHPWMMECLRKNGLTLEDFYRRNGQPFAAFQFGFKALWLRHFREDVYNQTWKLVTPLAILAHAFGAEGYVEENNNLSFWLVSDADRQKIDPELCGVFDVRPDIFPEAMDPGTRVGSVSAEASKLCGLLPGTPIYLGSGDQNCGTLGAGNYGTSGIVSLCMGTAGLAIGYSPVPIRHPRAMCQIQGHPAGGYLMETHSSSCMSSYRWAENLMYSARGTASDGPMAQHRLSEEATEAPLGANGVLFLPWLQGAACPHYDDAARGAFIGMALSSRRSDLARATMEGICFENRMMLETLWEADIPRADFLRIIGGAANNDFWNQMQADIYGLPVETITARESTALGAAIIGAVAAGLYPDYKSASDGMTHVLRRYESRAENTAAYDEIYSMWDECYQGLSRGAFRRIYDYQTGGGEDPVGRLRSGNGGIK